MSRSAEHSREIIDDHRRLRVQIAVLRGRTHLLILDLDNPPWTVRFSELSPDCDPWLRSIAQFIEDEQRYHWDTPRYRELCLAGGLDPDSGRPQFQEKDRDACEFLLREVNAIDIRPEGPFTPAAADIALDIVQLLRTDEPNPRPDIRCVAQRFTTLEEQDSNAATALRDVAGRILNEIRAQLPLTKASTP